MSDPWTIIQNAVFGHTGCDGDMADRTASAIENLLEQAGYEITPIARQPAPPASGDVGALCERLRAYQGGIFHARGMSIKPRAPSEVETVQITAREAEMIEQGIAEAATLLESLSRNGEAKLRSVISHATGGATDDTSLPLNDICVRITQHVNRAYEAGQARNGEVERLREALEEAKVALKLASDRFERRQFDEWADDASAAVTLIDAALQPEQRG